MAKDILIAETGAGVYDLVVRNGDFVVGESSRQHAALILATSPGEWRRTPGVGARLASSLKATDADYILMERRLRQQLEADGMRVERLATSQAS